MTGADYLFPIKDKKITKPYKMYALIIKLLILMLFNPAYTLHGFCGKNVLHLIKVKKKKLRSRRNISPGNPPYSVAHIQQIQREDKTYVVSDRAIELLQVHEITDPYAVVSKNQQIFHKVNVSMFLQGQDSMRDLRRPSGL